MSGRHQPLNGADSDYSLHRYRVLMEGDDEGRIWVTVAAAMGPRDAQNQAREDHPEWTPIKAEVLNPVEATFDEWTTWAGLR